jgi:hypothetical protein
MPTHEQPRILKRLERGTERIAKEAKRRKEATEEDFESKLQAEREEEEQELAEEKWERGESCFREGSGYYGCGRHPAFISLDEAKAIAARGDEILFQRTDGCWYLFASDEYVEYYKQDGDILYDSAAECHGVKH